MPVARCGDHLGHGLQAATALKEALEIIAGRAVDEKDVGLRAVGEEAESAVIGSDAEIEERVVEPDLIFDGGQVTLLFAGDRGRDGIEWVEADVAVVGAVIEEGGMEDVFGCDVVLQAEEG